MFSGSGAPGGHYAAHAGDRAGAGRAVRILPLGATRQRAAGAQEGYRSANDCHDAGSEPCRSGSDPFPGVKKVGQVPISDVILQGYQHSILLLRADVFRDDRGKADRRIRYSR